jgi:hypothetical protein
MSSKHHHNKKAKKARRQIEAVEKKTENLL